MRSTLSARSAVLSEEPKGALFLLKRYSRQAIFGIKLSEPEEQPNGSKPTVLLLNPDFGHEGRANFHRVFLWEADERCVSFGTDWIVQPNFTATSLSEMNDPQEDACLTIGPGGIHFRAAPGDGYHAAYRHFIHVDSLELAKDLGNAAFHLTGYQIFLNQQDWEKGRQPLYQRGI